MYVYSIFCEENSIDWFSYLLQVWFCNVSPSLQACKIKISVITDLLVSIAIQQFYMNT